MFRNSNSRTICGSMALALALTLAAPGEAQAYLDLGTGSAVIQIVIASVAGALLSLKLYWHRLANLILRRRSSSARPRGQGPRDA